MKRPRPLTFVIFPGNSAASSFSLLRRNSPVVRAFSTSFSSAMISRNLRQRTMSMRFPPHVELMREETVKTLSFS